MAPLRLFIAADTSSEQKAAALELMEALRKGISFTKARPAWVKPEGLHLTLKFLGNVEAERVDEIVRAVEPAVLGVPVLRFELKGLGVFPSPHRPQVLWVGVGAGSKEMCGLAATVEQVLVRLGFAPEQRPFHPHLTLARMKSLSGAEAMMDVVHSHRRADLGAADLRHLTLYQSRLAPTGATYQALHHWPLRAQDPA
jgi:2'-5' RNA ligase